MNFSSLMSKLGECLTSAASRRMLIREGSSASSGLLRQTGIRVSPQCLSHADFVSSGSGSPSSSTSGVSTGTSSGSTATPTATAANGSSSGETSSASLVALTTSQLFAVLAALVLPLVVSQ